jgi:hypothetical protein
MLLLIKSVIKSKWVAQDQLRMKITEHIRCVFDDAQAGKLEAALLHACISIDATARRLYPSMIGSGARFTRCIREYLWLVEPMVGLGINLAETKFSNLTLPRSKGPPDFADVIYAIHRNSHAHGDEVPISYELIRTIGPYGSVCHLAPECLRIPDRIVWALTAVAVFSRKNPEYRGWGGDRYLSWGEQRFTIADWWGRETDLMPIAASWNSIRVKMEKLERLKEAAANGADGRCELIIVAPPQSAPPDLMSDSRPR